MSEVNPRVVVETEQGALNSKFMPLAWAGVYFFSLHQYNKYFFRINGNAVYMGAFALASIPCAYAHANFWFGSGLIEAAAKNNARERMH